MEKNFQELIEYLDNKFIDIDRRFDNMNKKFDDLQTSVDSYAKRADAYFQEMTMMAHKIDRHEKWIQKLAHKLGVELEY